MTARLAKIGGVPFASLYTTYGTHEALRDLCGTDNSLVLGEGAERPQAIFVGEAPGRRENTIGRPFVGTSGRTLNKALEGNQLLREKMWITNAVKIWPVNEDGSTRTPDACEISESAPYLWSEIVLLCQSGPRWPVHASPLVVALGRSALAALTGDDYAKLNLDGLHGKFLNVDHHGSRFTVLPTYHPSGLRSNETREAFRRDFEAIRREIRSRNRMGLYDYAA